MLEIRRLCLQVGRFQMRDVELEVEEPILGIIGPNGSGKSSLLKGILGEGRVGGEVYWDGQLLGRGETSRLARSRVRYVPDSWPDLFDPLTPGELWSFLAKESLMQDQAPPDMLTVAFTMADVLGLSVSRTRCKDLSFGSRRKVQLVAGMMASPGLLILDEPQNGLDFVASRSLSGLLRELSNAGAQVIIASHDLGSVVSHASRVIGLYEGRVRIDRSVDQGTDLESLVKDLYFK